MRWVVVAGICATAGCAKIGVESDADKVCRFNCFEIDAPIDAMNNGDGPASIDGPAVDAAAIDAPMIDAPSQFSQACTNGPGFSLLRFGFQSNNIRLEHWDASCQYSLADQACHAALFGTTEVDSTAVSMNASDIVRARFSVTGLSFTGATLYLKARGVGSSARFSVFSPIHGTAQGPLVPVDFSYKWFSLDWSNYLTPQDQPSLTAIQIERTNGTLAVQEVELCVF